MDEIRPKRRMDHPMPLATPFVMDAEAEIRRNTERHFAMVTEIEQTKTDRDHWKSRAELAETDNARLLERLKAADQYTNELKELITTLKAQFETGAQIWLNGYNALNSVSHLKLVMPPALKAIEGGAPPRED